MTGQIKAALIAAFAATALVAAAPAPATAASKDSGKDCFLISQWHGWSAPSDDVIYLQVNFRDVYKAELTAPTSALHHGDAYLISIDDGSYSVCNAVDLRLSLAQRYGGFRQGLIVKSLTKLTPQEVAAIPKKDRPE